MKIFFKNSFQSILPFVESPGRMEELQILVNKKVNVFWFWDNLWLRILPVTVESEGECPHWKHLNTKLTKRRSLRPFANNAFQGELSASKLVQKGLGVRIQSFD